MILEDDNDNDLIESYFNGDENSLEIIIDKYINPIYNFIFRICNDVNVAEDLTAETFLKVWKNLKKYDTKKNFRVWIFSVAKNTTIDWLRKKKDVAFSQFETDDDQNYMENTLVSEEPAPDEYAIFEENKRILSEAISKLPALYRTILTMEYTEGFSKKEISQILGKPEETIKSQHRRALIKLRSILTG